MTQRSLVGEAMDMYAEKDEDFLELIHYHLEQHEGSRRCIYSTPDYLILAEIRYHPEHGWHWRINYAASTQDNALSHFVEIAPFKLDKVAFCRYRNTDKFKYYNWDTLERFVNG